MTSWTVVARSLRHYWRMHLAIAAGAAVGCAILVGALFVGDSVRYTLRRLALARVGSVELALAPPGRVFREQLADDLQHELKATIAPVLQVRAVASAPDTGLRVNEVRVLGVEARFWSLGPGGAAAGTALSPGQVALSESLASQLGVKAGDTILLRIEAPSALPLDDPLSSAADSARAARLAVSRVVPESGFGRFSLQAGPAAALNAFVTLEWLQGQVSLRGCVNTLLACRPGGAAISQAAAEQSLRKCWRLADAGVAFREVPGRGMIEIVTDRVFLDPPIMHAAAAALPDARGVFTYFVNELRVRDRSTPYSLVTAIGPLVGERPSPASGPGRGAADTDWPSPDAGGIVVSQWLADDLAARAGDAVRISYFLPGAGHRLVEHTNQFTITAVAPTVADPDLMPPFPGMEATETCRDWKSGVPIDFSRIRPKDEEYWREYRGTPKALLSLPDGQQIWSNRFGVLTAIRSPGSSADVERVASAIERRLDPAALGFYLQPVREQALKAGSEGMDFGPLFLGFSFFLLASAVLLTGLLFVFAIEQRSEEMGLLLAVGFSVGRVRRIYLAEGAVLAALGGVVGGIAGWAYTRGILLGLSTFWRGAVAGAHVQFHAGTASAIGGVAAGVAVACLAMAAALRKQSRVTVRELLAGSAEWAPDRGGAAAPRRNGGFWLGAASGFLAVLIAVVFGAGHGPEAAGAFFASGALLLVAGLAGTYSLLARLGSGAAPARLTVRRLAVRGAARRVGRSLATVGLLACATFLIVAVGANRQGAPADTDRPSSGTGGFQLLGRSTLPILDDLNAPEARRRLGMDGVERRAAEFLPLRVREGDDASCLNLNRAQTPRVLGVRPQDLASRGSFTFVKTLGPPGKESPWLALDAPDAGGAVPAVGDETTLEWGLHMAVGDTLQYRDDAGRIVLVKIVGVIANSVLQGSLVISDRSFQRMFPSESGYRMFLVRAPARDTERLRKALSRAMEDSGLELTSTRDRLASLSVVENTYLSVFQGLGGLGLLLGSVGLGLVVSRNIRERRAEFGLLRAVGFSGGSLRRLAFGEHALLLLLGLGIGVASAAVAVAPALGASGGEVPWLSLAAMLALVILNGLLWMQWAIHLAFRAPLLAALRNE